jgi:hypothetical protein
MQSTGDCIWCTRSGARFPSLLVSCPVPFALFDGKKES